jgi:hypothetical protein
MGSGKILKAAQNKYGIQNFTKEILFVFNCSQDMFNQESKLVNDVFVADDNTYNIKTGGHGGWDFVNKNQLNAFYNIDCALKGRRATDRILRHKYGRDWRTVLGRIGQRALMDKRISNKDFDMFIRDRLNSSLVLAREKANSPKSRKKRKESFAKINHQKGEKNSQFNTFWITDGSKNKKCKKGSLIPDGWFKGRTTKI